MLMLIPEIPLHSDISRPPPPSATPLQLDPRGLAACAQYVLFPLTHQLQHARADDERTRMLALACVDALVRAAGVASREAVRLPCRKWGPVFDLSRKRV
jgi:hypothetical protein